MFTFALLRLPGMTEKGRVFASLRDGPRFPAALWDRFRAAARYRGESWIDALRAVVERYVHEAEAAQSAQSDESED